MKTLTALAIVVALVSTAIHAQTGEPRSKQDTGARPPQAVSTRAGRFYASCGGGPNASDFKFVQVARRVPELKVVVDFSKNSVGGSILLPPAVFNLECGSKVLDCGKLKAEEGRIQGRAFEFTTYRSIDGMRIPTRWRGEPQSGGGLIFSSIDPVPCPISEQLVRQGASVPASAPVGSLLVYRRGDVSKNVKAGVAPNATGKWWTIDGRRLITVALKADGKGRLSGTINLCAGGGTERGEFKIEKGSISGGAVSFETGAPLVMRGARVQWKGELVDGDTLKLSKGIDADPCGFVSAAQLILRKR